jgi:hypothetical protein
LQARESRLVVSEQIKAERETAIVDGAIDRLFTSDARRRWARRLAEMALIFGDTGRADPAGLAAAEVALGRAKLSEVSRSAVRPSPS